MKKKFDKFLNSAVLSNIHDAVIVTDRNGKIKIINPMAEALTGWNKEIALGKSLKNIFSVIDEIIHKNSVKEVRELLKKEDFFGKEREASLISKEGRKIPIYYKGDPIKDENDDIIGFILIFRDISHQKTAKNRLNRAMAAGNLAWWEMELPSGLVDFNERKATMLGYSSERFEYYEDFTELLHPEDYEAAMQAMRAHLEGRSPRYEVEYRIKMKSGEYKWFRDVGRITEEKENEDYQKVTGIVIDIDDRKKTKQQVKGALERSNFYKDLLAHDMANILNNIKASMRLMDIWKHKPNKEDKVRDLEKNINKQLERGGTLISNVRKISKLEGDEMGLKEINIIKILNSAIKQTYSRFQGKNLDIETDFPQEPIKAKGGDLLLDAFENILLNGALHNESERKKLWVELSNVQKGEIDFIKIEFKDNGIGIGEEKKKSLFGKNYQREESKIGMGIGLSLVKKIISEYNGKIWVENRLPEDIQKGSNFIVLLEKA